jgi:hypothetical protein
MHNGTRKRVARDRLRPPMPPTGVDPFGGTATSCGTVQIPFLQAHSVDHEAADLLPLSQSNIVVDGEMEPRPQARVFCLLRASSQIVSVTWKKVTKDRRCSTRDRRMARRVTRERRSRKLCIQRSVSLNGAGAPICVLDIPAANEGVHDGNAHHRHHVGCLECLQVVTLDLVASDFQPGASRRKRPVVPCPKQCRLRLLRCPRGGGISHRVKLGLGAPRRRTPRGRRWGAKGSDVAYHPKSPSTGRRLQRVRPMPSSKTQESSTPVTAARRGPPIE